MWIPPSACAGGRQAVSRSEATSTQTSKGERFPTRAVELRDVQLLSLGKRLTSSARNVSVYKNARIALEIRPLGTGKTGVHATMT
jgi:hypothetical protein